jgi:hypothetical protein
MHLASISHPLPRLFPRRHASGQSAWFLTVALFVSAFGVVRAEQTGPPHRVLAADYSAKRLGLVNEKGELEWEYPIRDIHDLWVLPNGNFLFQPNWTEIIEVTPGKQVVWRYDAATRNGNEGRRVEVHAFQPLKDGSVMIAESGPARIIEVDRNGRIQHEMKLKVDHPDPHRDTRLVRKLATGNYLVAHEGDSAVREYSASGAVVWEYSVGSQVYSAERLASGNTLIGCGGGSRVIEVDKSGKVIWSVGKTDLPGVTLAWITMVERLDNGNTRFVNCHAGPENPQILEVTPEKKIAWSFRDFRHFGNSLPVARVLPSKK